jgi:hypothetical protein
LENKKSDHIGAETTVTDGTFPKSSQRPLSAFLKDKKQEIQMNNK